MNVVNVARTACILAAIAVTPAMLMGTERRVCKSEQPTQESYAWNFPNEASGILKDVRADAAKVERQADRLRGFSMNTGIDWQIHAGELSGIKTEVNDMGAKLCRLETIRRVVLPWQRQAIDRTEALVREMAGNADQAISYLNHNQDRLWSPAYRQYAANLYNESDRLSHAIGDLEKLARLREEEKDMRVELATPAGS